MNQNTKTWIVIICIIIVSVVLIMLRHHADQGVGWLLSGVQLGLLVPLLLLIGNKKLGISSSFRHVCAIISPKISFFNYDWRSEAWNLFFVVGIMVGGFIAVHTVIGLTEPFTIATETQGQLLEQGITEFSSVVPMQIFSLSGEHVLPRILIFFVTGGFLLGFGSRYAGGCTSGHAIMGLSTLQLPSLVAVISFFVGGLLMTHAVLPIILKAIFL